MNAFIRDGEVTCRSPITIDDLCIAGATAQAFSDIDNRPKSQDSIDALNSLILNILEPIRLYYGSLTITHGFTSQALVNRVPRGVAKQLDQHCAHEVNTRGKRICPRDGASADIYVNDITTSELAEYITRFLPFDRMYLYGRSTPIHISYARSSSKREVVVMAKNNSGKKTPRVIRSVDIQNEFRKLK